MTAASSYWGSTHASSMWLHRARSSMEFGVTFPSIDDRAGAFAYSFGFPYLPVTYVVDASGTMRYRLFGAVTADELGRIIAELQKPG